MLYEIIFKMFVSFLSVCEWDEDADGLNLKKCAGRS